MGINVRHRARYAGTTAVILSRTVKPTIPTPPFVPSGGFVRDLSRDLVSDLVKDLVA